MVITNEILLVCVAGALAYFLVRYYWKRQKLYKDINELHGPFALPIFGSAHLFLGVKNNYGYVEVVDRLIRDYPPPTKLWVGPCLCYVTMDPQEIEIIMKHPAANQKPYHYKIFTNTFGQGLFIASGDVWKKHRRLLEPTFKQTILNHFVATIVGKGDELVTILKHKAGKGSFDIYPFVKNCSLSIILEFVIGVNKKDIDDTIDYGALVTKGSEILYTRAFKPAYLCDVIYKWTALYREENKLVGKLHSFMDDVVNRRKYELKAKCEIEENKRETLTDLGPKNTKERAFLLDLLLEKGETANYTMKQIRDELTTFIIAGYDTIAFVLSVTFIMLGMFPEVQKKVYEETMEVIGPTKNIEHSDLSKLKYLDMVIKETMRLFPVSPFIGRYLQDNITLGLRMLPKGIHVMVPLMHIHRNEKFWPEPLTFQPERFSPEESAKRHPYSSLPFSAGPRNCIGMRLALMEIKIIIAMAVRECVIKTDYSSIQDLRLEPNVIYSLIDGYNCSTELRKND